MESESLSSIFRDSKFDSFYEKTDKDEVGIFDSLSQSRPRPQGFEIALMFTLSLSNVVRVQIIHVEN